MGVKRNVEGAKASGGKKTPPTPRPTKKDAAAAVAAQEGGDKAPVPVAARPATRRSVGKGKDPVVAKAAEVAAPMAEKPQESIADPSDPKEGPVAADVKEEVDEETVPNPNPVLNVEEEDPVEDPVEHEELVEEYDMVEVEELVEEELVEVNEEDEGADAEGADAEVASGVVEGDQGVEEAEEEGAGEEDDNVRLQEQVAISDMYKARKMKRELEIFVGGLDRDAVEENLKEAFQKVGEVVEIRLHKDSRTNKNKGYAFVKFATKDQVARALSELKNPLVRQKRCGIAPSEENDTLFLGNICNTWTKDAIRNKLKDYGIEVVENVTLVADAQKEGLSRGFAFVEFPCHADAMLAYKRLQKPDVIFGHAERTVRVAFAQPLREPDPEVMSQVKSVFIDGLPSYWDEDRVKEQFKQYGEIEHVVLARNMSTAKRKDFGFVNFKTHEEAIACVEGTNNTELDDGKSKFKVRARLASPLPKAQAVKGGMSGGFRIGHTGICMQSRFGRGFGRGKGFPQRASFKRGRGSYQRGRGGFDRNSFPSNPYESSEVDFHDGRHFGFPDGRRGSLSLGHHAFSRERGRSFIPRRQPLNYGEYDRPFVGEYFDDDPYFYSESGRGFKRPFSMMERDYGYLDSERIHPRFERPDPVSDVRYRGSFGRRSLYSHDYYASDYGDGSGPSGYPSRYHGDHSEGGYYY